MCLMFVLECCLSKKFNCTARAGGATTRSGLLSWLLENVHVCAKVCVHFTFGVIGISDHEGKFFFFILHEKLLYKIL